MWRGYGKFQSKMLWPVVMGAATVVGGLHGQVFKNPGRDKVPAHEDFVTAYSFLYLQLIIK